MWQEITIAGLVLANILTIVWAMKTRVKASPQVKALQRAIAAFEVEGQTILHIDRVNPDNVYLRNPGR